MSFPLQYKRISDLLITNKVKQKEYNLTSELGHKRQPSFHLFFPGTLAFRALSLHEEGIIIELERNSITLRPPCCVETQATESGHM